ncbi:MAG: SagB/ThcOx family dehydrogenase [Acidobacteriia bacterium]|nr:SagB/ThcOx family dehydrogenase [Terriglobia bacterium]
MKNRRILVKRSNCLIFFFQDGKFHYKNYLSGREFEASPVLVPILAQLDRWRTIRDIERLLPGYTGASIRSSLRRLIAHTAVVIKGSSASKREEELSAWRIWGVEARFFHYATKNIHAAPLTIDEASFNRALKRRQPPPPSVKTFPTRRQIDLPDPSPHLRGQLPEVLLKRRTHRHFGAGKVSLDQLSILLRLTWGFTNYIQWPGLGRLPVKTSPSGGARHSLEVYLWCSRISGLDRGIYHYRPDRHTLELMKKGKFAHRMDQLCGHQDWVQDCSVLFVMTTILARVMWRYRFSRAYRVILLEAGHFCQTFCLVATWLGLAPFCTAALDDEMIDDDLGLSAGEAVLYAAGVGMPP